MKVKDPTGQTWRVTRRWVPWRRQLRTVDGPDLSWVPSLGDDPISAILLVLVLILMLPFVVLALLVAAELLLLLLLLPVAVAVRVAFGRHWTIEARRGFAIWWDAPSGGWRESGARIRSVAAAISRGDLPPGPSADAVSSS